GASGKEEGRRRESGLVEAMSKVAEALGVGVDEPLRDEDWMDEYQVDDPEEELVLSPASAGGAVVAASGVSKRHKIRTPRLRYGWPQLQVAVMRECVAMAEGVGDHTKTILLISHLLRTLHPYLTKQDQQDLMTVLQGVVVHFGGANTRSTSSHSSASLPTNQPILQCGDGTGGRVKGLGGVVLRKVVGVRQSLRKVPVVHPKSMLKGGAGEGEGTVKKDPFLYNPFAKGKKEEGEIILVAGEMAWFDVTLANPFEFDLEVGDLRLATTGPNHTPTPLSTLIPAKSRAHTVRVSLTPHTSGTLTVHGIYIRLFNSCIEEYIRPIKRVVKDKKGALKEVFVAKQSERERFGKEKVEFLGGIVWEGAKTGEEGER
ncbi:hypothetical protein HK097_006499, partial [Rhizophlyctis rosea]